jgi:hypothetical protein
MRKSSSTPSLAPGQAYKNKTGNSYREHIGSATSFPPIRNIDERALKWHDPAANAKKVSHGARPAKKAPR